MVRRIEGGRHEERTGLCSIHLDLPPDPTDTGGRRSLRVGQDGGERVRIFGLGPVVRPPNVRMMNSDSFSFFGTTVSVDLDGIEGGSWVIFKPPREHDDGGRSPLRSRRFLVSVIAAAALLFASLTPSLAGAAPAPSGSPLGDMTMGGGVH